MYSGIPKADPNNFFVVWAGKSEVVRHFLIKSGMVHTTNIHVYPIVPPPATRKGVVRLTTMS